MLFNTDMMSRYEYGEEVVELDPTSGKIQKIKIN